MAGYVPPLESNRNQAFRGVRRNPKQIVNLQSVLDKFPFLSGKPAEPPKPDDEKTEVLPAEGVTPCQATGAIQSGTTLNQISPFQHDCNTVELNRPELHKSDSTTSLNKPLVKKKKRSRSRKPRGDGEDALPSDCDIDDASSVTSESSEHSVKLRKKGKRRKSHCPIHSKSKRNSKTLIVEDGDTNIPVICTFEGRGVTLPLEEEGGISQHPETGEVTSSKPIDDVVKLNKQGLVCTCRSRLKACTRPEPEGGQPAIDFALISEFDKIIYSTEPIFSDLENDPNIDEQIKQESERHHRKNVGTGIFSAAQMINSNTMMKFAIIQTELKNMHTTLRRAEGEVAALTRRIRLLEEDFEQTESRLNEASSKLEEASKAADESERQRMVLEKRSYANDDRLSQLEDLVKQSTYIQQETETKYEECKIMKKPCELSQEAARKLAITEVDLERAEARLESADAKILELEEELKVVGNNMKSLEISEQEASQREDSYEESIRDLTARLKDAEHRATEAERTVSKLQKEVDRLEDELLAEKEKYKTISEDLDCTFAELAGF